MTAQELYTKLGGLLEKYPRMRDWQVNAVSGMGNNLNDPVTDITWNDLSPFHEIQIMVDD